MRRVSSSNSVRGVAGGDGSPGDSGSGSAGRGGGGAGRSLSGGEKAAMAFDVARGMLHLHENGFLHGSLKCKNVMVSETMMMMMMNEMSELKQKKS